MYRCRKVKKTWDDGKAKKPAINKVIPTIIAADVILHACQEMLISDRPSVRLSPVKSRHLFRRYFGRLTNTVRLLPMSRVQSWVCVCCLISSMRRSRNPTSSSAGQASSLATGSSNTSNNGNTVPSLLKELHALVLQIQV